MEIISLATKTAIVTGAGSGIGKASALRLASAGAAVLCFDLAFAEKTADEICEAGGIGAGFAGDAALQRDWEGAYSAGELLRGPTDILVNVAGRNSADTVADFTESQLDMMLSINLKSVMLGMRCVIPSMVKNKSGKVVNTSTGATFFGVPNQASYAASKGGINAITLQSAVQYAKFNIQINAISPGLTDTAMVAAADRRIVESVAAATPAGRMGQPDEIASAVLFLVSPLSSFINGTILSVDGGLLAS